MIAILAAINPYNRKASTTDRRYNKKVDKKKLINDLDNSKAKASKLKSIAPNDSYTCQREFYLREKATSNVSAADPANQ